MLREHRLVHRYQFDDPIMEIAYRVVERAVLDAQGHIFWAYIKEFDKERPKSRKEIVMEARAWIKERGGWFDFYCGALDIDSDGIRKRLKV